MKTNPLRPGHRSSDIWKTNAAPAPITATEPDPTLGPRTLHPAPRGTVIRIAEIAPESDELRNLTPEGELTLLLDDEDVLLKAGDVVIQRGANHAWSNRSGQPCRILYVLMDGEFDAELAARFKTVPGH